MGLQRLAKCPEDSRHSMFHLSHISNIISLSPNAFAVALLGLIEAVAIGQINCSQNPSADQWQSGIHRTGIEQHVVGSFFSCYAGSGSFTRSGVNYDAGARTPMAAIFAALLLMLIMLFIAPYANYLPIPAMAGIIMLVAYNLIDFHHIRKILKASTAEFTVLTVTFISTLFLQLEFAIYFGVILSLVFYLQRTSQPQIFEVAPDPDNGKRKFFRRERKDLLNCPQLIMVRLDGSLFYGAVTHVAKELSRFTDRPERNLLIIGNGINIIDVSGAELLVNQSRQFDKAGKKLFICGLKKGAREFLIDGGYMDEIGEERFFTNKQDAVHSIYGQLDKSICAECQNRIFVECKS